MLTRTALLMCSVLAILSVGVWHYANISADYSYDRLLSSASVSMLDGISVSSGKIHIDLPYSAFEILQLAPNDKIFYAVYGTDGKLLSGYGDLPQTTQKLSGNLLPTQYYLAQYRGQKVRFVQRVKHFSERSVAGDISLILGQTTKARDQQMRDALYAALTTLMTVMAIALLVMWIAINRALSPLSWISQQLTAKTALQTKPLPDSNMQEVAPLVEGINNYRQQWLDALASMRDFITDASHQIRTAQATTKAQMEIALSSQQQTIERQAVEDIYQDHSKLTRLTNQLLAHATITHRGDRKAFCEIELDELLRTVLTQSVRDYAHTEIEFEYLPCTHPVLIHGDDLMLKEAICNLIDNAVLHAFTKTPKTSVKLIKVSLLTQLDSAVVQVDDSGRGIPSEMRAFALKRFQKLDSQTAGSGLGLAIAHTVALAHKGQLTLLDSDLGGLRVEIAMPKHLKERPIGPDGSNTASNTTRSSE